MSSGLLFFFGPAAVPRRHYREGREKGLDSGCRRGSPGEDDPACRYFGTDPCTVPVLFSRIGTSLAADVGFWLIRLCSVLTASETPSTHYTVPNHAGGSLPPYAPPERVAGVSASGRHNSSPSMQSASMASSARRAGSASAASGQGGAANYGFSMNNSNAGRRGDLPNLSQFRIPSWSTVQSSPNARLYHSVALRRVAAAEHASAAAEIGGLMRRLAILERAEMVEAVASARNGAGDSNAPSGSNTNTNTNTVARPLEDPHLVGEAAARRTRAARLACDNPAPVDDALAREDRRWDWFLGSFARPSNLPSSRHVLPLASRRHTRLHRGIVSN